MKKQPLSIVLIATIVISGAITSHGQTQIKAVNGELAPHHKSIMHGILKVPVRFPS